jgi:hypothetical protein
MLPIGPSCFRRCDPDCLLQPLGVRCLEETSRPLSTYLHVLPRSTDPQPRNAHESLCSYSPTYSYTILPSHICPPHGCNADPSQVPRLSTHQANKLCHPRVTTPSCLRLRPPERPISNSPSTACVKGHVESVLARRDWLRLECHVVTQYSISLGMTERFPRVMAARRGRDKRREEE